MHFQKYITYIVLYKQYAMEINIINKTYIKYVKYMKFNHANI